MSLEVEAADQEVTAPFLPQINSSPSSNSRPKMEPMPTRKLIRWAKICAAILVLAIVLIVISAFAHKPASQIVTSSFFSGSKSGLGSQIFIKDSNSIVFLDQDKSTEYLSILFPQKFISASDDPHSERCEFPGFGSAKKNVIVDNVQDVLQDRQTSCLQFENGIRAAIYETDRFNKLECHVVHWYSHHINDSLENCIDISTDNWYGGGDLSIHRWPLNRASVSMQPFITRNLKNTNPSSEDAHFASFLEPYFLSAKGVAVLVDDNLPLFVSVNHGHKKRICFKSSFQAPFNMFHSVERGLQLKYTVCKDSSARGVHQQILELSGISHPKRNPSLATIQKPVWSTRGQNISNEIELLSFVSNIKNFNSNFSQLFIDGNYSKSSGNFYFDEKKFPHSAQIVMELDEMVPEKKLKVGTEVHPHIPDFMKDKNYSFNQVTHTSSSISPLYLDVFNEKACEWYLSKLKDIQEQVHINSFRFSGGEVSNFISSDNAVTFRARKYFPMNTLTTRYSDIASRFPDGSFIGSGYKSQVHGLVADAGPFLSTWDHMKGLKSIIPTVITLGLIGYPFISAGPVGGISQKDQRLGHSLFPSEDLYIRWLQLSIFLPVIEFSTGPWEYGPAVAKHAKALLEFRQNTLWPLYLSAAVKEAVDVGTPIIRPLWWIAPDDPVAQFIDCEFVVSNSLLVAPILVENATSRQIYLPEGHWWQDVLHGNFYQGGQWLPGFQVNRFEIATFIAKAPPKS